MCDLMQQRVDCSLNDGLCSLRFGGAVGDVANSSSTWTPTFTAELDNETGQEISVDVQACGSGEPATGVFSADEGLLPYLEEGPGNLLSLPLPIDGQQGKAPVTVAICYCPEPTGRPCTSTTDFTQQVGLMFLFTTAVCDPSEGQDCTRQYDSVIVYQPFMLSIFCPPLGCRAGSGSRVKLVRRSASPAALLPSWDEGNSCRGGLHLDSWLPRGTCNSASECFADGGLRQDRRTWGGTGGWLAWEPLENPGAVLGSSRNPGAERIDLRGGADIDICFCDGDCTGGEAGWFKAGEMRVAGTVLASAPSSLGVPGAVLLDRPPGDSNALGLARLGTIKLLSDPSMSVTTTDCNVLGHAKEVLIRDAQSNTSMLFFKEGDDIVVHAVGVLAVCFCSSFEGDDTCSSGGFFMAGRFTVRGPDPGQSFVVSTKGLFHLDFTGHGLDAFDRLLLSEAPCDGAPAASSSVSVGCPLACSPGEITQPLLLTDSTVGCDPLGNSCQRARIMSITLGRNGTELVFERDPQLEEGDRIVLSSGVQGGTALQQFTLQGSFNLSSSGLQSMVGHKVLRGADKQTWHLPLSFSGEDAPSFVVPPEGLGWARTSRAATRRELLAPSNLSAAPRLHVCWSSSSPASSGWHSVGVLEFREPPSMPHVAIALVAPISQEAVPAIVSFRTGSSPYPPSSHGSALLLRFENTSRLTPKTSTGADPTVGLSRAAGSQSQCAQILLETWSDGNDSSFPVPKRCRFGSPFPRDGREVLEFEIEFEPFAGLKENSSYQLVLNVAAADGAAAGEALLSVEAMLLQPDSAFEAGLGLLEVDAPARRSAGPGLSGASLVNGGSFLPAGGSVRLVPLEESGPFSLKLLLTGDSAEGLPRGSNLKVLLWPLTQWSLEMNASASCEAPVECSPTVSTEPLDRHVGNRNSILLSNLQTSQGGAEVAISDSRSVTLTLTGVAGISGGFFAARPAILVAHDATSTLRYFQATTGTALHRATAPSAALVSSRGHGNSEPFPAATNALYMRLFLPLSLPAGGSLMLESPAHFSSCGQATLLPQARLKDNPLRYPGGGLSQGSWTTTSILAMDPGIPCCNESQLASATLRTCRWTYSVGEAAGYLAGSSAYVQVSVLNPPFPVSAGNSTAGSWRVSMRGFGALLSAEFQKPEGLEPLDFAKALPVLAPMPFAQTLPADLLPGARHSLQLFFALRRRLGPTGSVEVWAPQGFDFGEECSASDIADDNYVYGTGPSVEEVHRPSVHRLPVPMGCTSRQWPVGAKEFTVARLGFGRPVLAGQRVALVMPVTNPGPGFRAAWTQQPAMWSVRALDADGHEVEGIDGTAALDGQPGNASQSWDLVAQALVSEPRLRWGPLIPFEKTLSASHVTVLPLEFRQDTYIPLRLTAAVGYRWDTPSWTGGFWSANPFGATATWPGGLPTIPGDTFLQWVEPVLFRAGFKYGFRTPIRIPFWPTTANFFYLEIGYVGATYNNATHPLGYVIPGTDLLRVTRNAIVDYTTGRLSEQQELLIRVTTVTRLYPEDGFLFIGGTATVRMSCTCPPDEFLTGLLCHTAKDKDRGWQILRLIATATIPDGTYQFPFACTNPALSEGVDTWTLGTYEQPQKYPRVVPIDAASVVRGFAMQKGMLAFERLTTPLAAGYDPRSRRRCGTILTFRLSNESGMPTDRAYMRLRAPEGTLFRWQCLEEVITASSEVFGPNVTLPEKFTALPPLLFCYGQGHLAHFHWEAGLLPSVDYVFRVDALNPAETPRENVWTLEVAGQSSGTAAAVRLHAFEQVMLEFVAEGARIPGSALGDKVTNRVRIRFVPTVAATVISLTAPAGYDFGDHQDCERMQLIGRENLGFTTAPFTPRLASCQGSGPLLAVQLNTAWGWTLRPGVTYFLDADVLMPREPAAVSPAHAFNLLSTAADGSYGDEYTVQAPAVVMAPLHFKVTNLANEFRAPEPVEVDVEVTFNSTLLRDERIELQLPRRFKMQRELGLCPVSWLQPPTGPAAECECDLAERCKIGFTVRENLAWQAEDMTRLHSPWPPGRPLRFKAFLTNPVFQPTSYENAFVIRHYPSARAINWTTPYGVGLYRGWPLVSPVLGLRFSIAAGSAQRAGAVGILHLTFLPSNGATILQVRALAPAGWNFVNAKVCLEKQASSCRDPVSFPEQPNLLELMNTELIAGVLYNRDVRGTVLAPVGGPTAFSLKTFFLNSQGERVIADQVDRHDSFRLPGLLQTTDPVVRTTRTATHPADVLWAQLPPRVGFSEALVMWRFTLTQKADVGDWLAIQVVQEGSLELETPFAQLKILAVHPQEEGLANVGDELLMDVEQVSPTTLRLLLRTPLHVFPAEYSARVSGKVLSDLQATASRFLNVSLCKSGEPLPMATNDAVPPGDVRMPEDRWTSVSQLPDFAVMAQGAAPLAQVIIAASSPSSASYPTLTLVAPVGVKIVSPCSPSACAAVVANFSGTGRQAAVNLNASREIALLVVLPLDWYDDSWVALTPHPTMGGAVAAGFWEASREITFRQMPVGLAYPAVGSVQGVRMSLSLHPGVGAKEVLSKMSTCFVRLRAPTGYGLQCGVYFKAINLPMLTEALCVEEMGEAVVSISAADALRFQQEIVFAFGLEVPAETPQRNIFRVELLTELNVTVDANTEIPGLPIPPGRLQSYFVMEVSGFENLAWLQSWAAEAHRSGAIQKGLADALEVPRAAVYVEHVEAWLKGRRAARSLAATLQGLVGVNFSTLLAVDSGLPNSLDTLKLRFDNTDLANSSMAAAVLSAAGEAGLAPVDLRGATLTPAVLVEPPNVTNPSLWWTSSKAETVSEVTIGLVFQSPTSGVAAMLFELPRGFEHQLEELGDLQVTLNGARHKFPVDEEWGRAWIETRNKGSLRILVSRSAPVGEGGYTFRFPVKLPRTVPALNVWQACLCSSVECDAPGHPSVFAVFAIPGFNIGEEFPRVPVAADAVRVGLSGLAMIALVFVQAEFGERP